MTEPLQRKMTGVKLQATACLLWIPLVFLLLAGCQSAPPSAYIPAEGDLVFQSLPRMPLVDAIEGVTQSPYSHCGMVLRRGDDWYVLEAIGPVMETPLKDWTSRGRNGWFEAYRMEPALAAEAPAILQAGRKYMGRPYDVHYDFDDERIYCSELIYKSVRDATGRQLGVTERLGDLNWKPHEAFIRSIEGDVPLEREMITPKALTEAPELRKVHPEEGNKIQRPTR